MAADAIVYCLENLTDYEQFERLSHDMMALDGYENIEPLGGSKDKGRDAIHVGTAKNSSVTVFAYSVREDWRKKLGEDSKKIQTHKHVCQELVFLCTAPFTASERDEAVAFIAKTYGWTLQLYGIERLAVMLRTTHSTVVAHHPSIFVPPFFPRAGGLSLSISLDHVVIDHTIADSALAHWLSRRLSLAGYFVWCRGLAPLAGSSVSETIRCLVSSRAAKYICILSPEALADPDFTARRFAAQAAGLQRDESLVLPALARQIDPTTLDQDTKKLSFADFSGGWAHGLDDVEKVLAATNCPRKPDGAGQQVLCSYVPTELVSNEPESLASNLFQVVRVPPAILRFYSTAPLLDEEGPLASKWAFRKVTDTHFLSFHRPPADLMREFGLTAKGGSVWNSRTEFDGIEVRDLIKELLKKSIYAECRRRGLVYCPDRKVTYFPEGLLKNEFLRFRDAAGVPQSFTVTGERKYGRGDRATIYRYQTAPVFVPIGSFADGYEIILRIRVRLTDTNNVPFPGHTGNSRRKKLCKSWWNADWLNRICGVMQFLANGEELIVIGDTPTDHIVIASRPSRWDAPVRLNEGAITAAQEEAEKDIIRIFDEDDDGSEGTDD